ncbi:ATP-dependent RNA helicase DeaD [Cognatiyoonia koreensis]|uniref:ATP-dependent RNA helicase DeaD n=1 Tax=Cognatiyoonia koreensis TaxID=364200 RepID=A0A1I0NYN9_9RHOB|nr:DEAD/DEAH box helicase [Cognatiyoonia koreensis]SEW07100.1 ATP-dependent RNA helicase DeaD [Cognatiyoonia koreensis]
MIQTLADALAKQGYDTLTPVQEAVTDPQHEGHDLLVSAQTGSGKTVGFGLAIGPTILNDDGHFGPADTPRALIIAPTRELALQVKRELSWLYAGAGAVMASCVGGMDMRTEKRTLERGAHIVVATPGRLKDHILRGSLDMSGIRAIVLDEADEMLDLGFREDLEFILGKAPETRRTLMFSATVPPMIEKLAKSYQRNAIRISTVSKATQHTDIAYRALTVAQHDADNAIINVLRYYEAPNAIVFANTRAMVTRLTTRLSNRGFAVVALSGELSQTERSHALQAMRDGRARVCVATDVAARGIDLPNLELVIHAELPTNAETLMHRSGRTGRAGRKGISAMIVPPKMRRRAENLLKWGKLKAEWAAPPSADEVQARDEERLLTDDVWTEEFTEGERAFAEKLLAQHAPEKIAAAYLRLYAGKASAPEDIAIIDPNAPPPPREKRERKEREPFGPSKWFSVDVGREGKAEARWLLPMICKAGDITKREIGAIRIQPNETFVEIREDAVPGFLKAVGNDMRLENQATLKALDGVPQISERGARPSKKSYDKPQDRSAPPPSRAPQQDAIKPIPGAADDPAPYKPRSKPPRKDHGDAVKAKKPFKSKDGGKPDFKGKGDAKPPFKSKGDAKPPFKGKSDGKPPRKGKPGEKPFRKPDGAKPAGKPRASASDTSKRFVPPGGKPRSKPGGKGPNATPKRRSK